MVSNGHDWVYDKVNTKFSILNIKYKTIVLNKHVKKNNKIFSKFEIYIEFFKW